MNFDDILKGLDNLAAGDDAVLARASARVAIAAKEIQSSNMSASEKTESLQDLAREVSIIQDMKQLEGKEKLNELINNLIMLYKLV